MSKRYKYILLIFYIPLMVSAQVSDAQKKMTLGDLIKKVNQENRGSKISQSEKKSVSVPEAQIFFSNNKPVNLKSIKPSKSASIYSYENADHIAYEKTLNLQINELYKMTEKFKNSSNRGELWLRLGELYVEKADIIDNRKQIEYDIKLKNFLAGKTKIRPELDLSEARDYNKKAIQLYEWFLKDFPNDPKISQALYFLGYNNFELGNVQAGTQYYEQLNKLFPASEYTGEAHFAVGETYFENEKWAEAYKEYSYLIKNKKHHLHNMALYKAAWCLYRVGKTEQGIKYLDYIIKTSRIAKNQNSSGGKKINNIRLENEATKDLAVFFADTLDMNRALSYFKNLNTQAAIDSIEKLGHYLSNNGNYDAAREVFKFLILRKPLDKKAFDYQYKIVQNYFFSKNHTQFKIELYRWISTYNKKSQWFAANSNESEFITRCDESRESTLRNYILQQHQTAQKTKSAIARQSAEESYKIYFQEFSRQKQAGEMHFFYAELLYELGRYDEAATEYWATIHKSPENDYIERAYQNVLLSLEKTLSKDEEFQKRVGNTVAPVAMDTQTSKFIAAADEYLEKYPKNEKSAEVRFRIGRLSYLTNNFVTAEKRFKEIVSLHSDTKYLEYSANLLLDMYSLKKDYSGLEKIGTELLSNATISNSKVGGEIKNVLEKASFKQAQNLEIERKYLDSARHFNAFALKNTKSELMPVAFYNAAINFERSAKNKEAIENYKKVIASRSAAATNLKPNAKRLLAKLYQETGMFSDAAQLYNDLANTNSADPLNTNYLYNTAVMHEITNNKNEAITVFNKYLKINKNAKENADIQFKIAHLLREQNRTNEAIDTYKKYLLLPEASVLKKIEAQYKIYELTTQSKLKTNLNEIEMKIKSLMAAVPEDKKHLASAYLAKISLVLAKETFNKLKSIAIPDNPRKQKAAVDKKLELMNKLNQQLGDIIKLNSAEEIVGALHLIGQSNEHMAQSFNSVSVPSGLNEDQRKLYLSEIEKITAPFVAKSEDGYKSAIEKGMELQTYNSAYEDSFYKMNQKYPQQFYYSGELPSNSRSIDWLNE